MNNINHWRTEGTEQFVSHYEGFVASKMEMFPFYDYYF